MGPSRIEPRCDVRTSLDMPRFDRMGFPKEPLLRPLQFLPRELNLVRDDLRLVCDREIEVGFRVAIELDLDMFRVEAGARVETGLREEKVDEREAPLRADNDLEPKTFDDFGVRPIPEKLRPKPLLDDRPKPDIDLPNPPLLPKPDMERPNPDRIILRPNNAPPNPRPSDPHCAKAVRWESRSMAIKAMIKVRFRMLDLSRYGELVRFQSITSDHAHSAEETSKSSDARI